MVRLTSTHSNYEHDESSDNQVKHPQKEAEEQRHLEQVESELESKADLFSTAGYMAKVNSDERLTHPILMSYLTSSMKTTHVFPSSYFYCA